jgi:tetratricopeptide (TPR) repeat protein
MNRYLLLEARKLLVSGQHIAAQACYEKLTRSGKATAEIWFEYGSAAAALRGYALADRVWRKAIQAEPENAALLTQIGHHYESIRMPERACDCFAQAARTTREAIDPRISLAVLWERQHRLGEAREMVAQCLAVDARDEQARFVTAILDRRENQLDRAEAGLRDLLSSEPKHPYVRYACRYELARLLDHIGQTDQAMKLLGEAKQIIRSLADVDVLLKSYDRAISAASQFTLAQPRNVLLSWAKTFSNHIRCGLPPLAFLGGHPRSGTTLLERVLDAHPRITAFDESSAFVAVIESSLRQTPSPTPAHLNVWRRRYVKALLDEGQPDMTHHLLVDKNPSLTTRLPIWLRLFPESRVIIVLRDPRDVVLSCYFQNLLLNAANANFLTLERTAKHYISLMGIWRIVREWENFSWLESRYESTVRETENEGGRATKFLGSEWNEAQSRFFRVNRQKQLYSPSYHEVTQPVYGRSVAKWRAYEKYLAPIMPILEPFCRAFGYD